ncbi:hypothetical protein OsI_17233 [Oryza sativa Indica Group]|uniref:Uncharacterized protein n=1 Tax=Oryza sativa subsp. indica TaxID=39946 RepID=B8ATK9_ORYSI|nr:hypothetical protein OsI_17233 [Oryza sativa Indica Group]
MDFHALPRRDLQALCKRNGVRANMTNAAMADALAKLATVDGIEEFAKQAVALPPAPATKPAVKAVAEEDPREKKGSPLPRGRRVTVSSPEVVNLDDSDEEAPGQSKDAPLPRGRRGTVRSSKFIRPDDGEEEGKEDENRGENAPVHGEGRRGASRRARAEPVVAPTTRRRAAPTSKIETGDVAVEAPPAPTTRRRPQTSTEAAPAPTTRRRAQSTVAASAEEKVPRGRRTTRRAAAKKPDMLEEETREPLAPEQNSAHEEPVQEEQGIEVEVPAETVEAVAQECLPDPDALVEEKPVQEEEVGRSDLSVPVRLVNSGIEVEEPAETVEAVAQECSPDAVVEDEQAAVEAEQTISQDDSPIFGIVTGTIVGASEEAPVCNSECPKNMATEESSDTVSEEKEAVPADEVPLVTVTCGEATRDAELPTNIGNAKEEDDDEMEAAHEAGFAVEVDGSETVDELIGTLTEHADNAIQLNFSAELSCADEEAGVFATDDLQQSSATVKTMVADSEANEEEDALEAENEVGFAVEEKEVRTGDEPHETVSNDADGAIQLGEDALEAANEAGCAVEEKGVETVDEPHDTETNAAENAQEEGVVASEDLLQISETEQEEFNSDICHAVEHNERDNVESVSSEREDVSMENAFTGDLTMKFDGPGDLGDRNTSLLEEGARTLPLSTETPNNVTDAVVTAAEEMVSETMGVSNKKSTELAAMEDGNEVKVVEKQKEDPVELVKLSLRTLRAKLKEKLTKHKRKEAKRVALGRLDENVC